MSEKTRSVMMVVALWWGSSAFFANGGDPWFIIATVAAYVGLRFSEPLTPPEGEPS